MGKGSKAWRKALVAGMAPASLLAYVGAAVIFAVDIPPLAHAAADDSRTSFVKKTPPKGTRVNVVASKITYDSKNRIATATGRVEITYGKYVLVATRVTYDLANVLEADRAQLRDKFREGFAEHLKLLLTNSSTVTADYATRHQGYLTIYEHVTYTRCQTCVLADGTPLWQIKSRRTTHNEREGVLDHEDATFQFAGQDIVTLPHFSQPDPTVKRRTGFLMPRASIKGLYGAGVTIPYFINLAPDYDLTLEPMITTGQGVLAHAE